MLLGILLYLLKLIVRLSWEIQRLSIQSLVPGSHAFPTHSPMTTKAPLLSLSHALCRSDYLAIPSENKENSVVPVEE